MAKLNNIERAHARYSTLLRLIEMEIVRARANPTADRYLDLGIIDAGDKPTEATAKIDARLGEIRDLIEHLGVLDIAATFELSFRQKISNSIGEARNAINNQRKKAGKTLAAPSLVKNLKEMQGLASIKSILSAGLSIEVQVTMEKIRESRNNFTHGTDLGVPPAIDAQSALDCLLDVLDSF